MSPDPHHLALPRIWDLMCLSRWCHQDPFEVLISTRATPDAPLASQWHFQQALPGWIHRSTAVHASERPASGSAVRAQLLLHPQSSSLCMKKGTACEPLRTRAPMKSAASVL